MCSKTKIASYSLRYVITMTYCDIVLHMKNFIMASLACVISHLVEFVYTS